MHLEKIVQLCTTLDAEGGLISWHPITQWSKCTHFNANNLSFKQLVLALGKNHKKGLQQMHFFSSAQFPPTFKIAVKSYFISRYTVHIFEKILIFGCSVHDKR